MSDNVEYLKKYKPDHLYTHPGAKGAYATIAGESEEVVGEIDVTSRCKLAVSAFHVHDSRDFGTFKITKLQFHKTHGWREDEPHSICVWNEELIQPSGIRILSVDAKAKRSVVE